MGSVPGSSSDKLQKTGGGGEGTAERFEAVPDRLNFTFPAPGGKRGFDLRLRDCGRVFGTILNVCSLGLQCEAFVL